MASFNDPTNTSLYSGVLATLRSLLASCVKLDPTADTNLPTGAVRHSSSSSNKIQKWNGTAWADADVHFGNSVGVKTTSPGADVDVGSGSTPVAPQVRLNGGTGTGAGGFVSFANGGTANSAVGAYSGIVGGAQNNSLTIFAGTGNEVRVLTNGVNERLRIDSSGNHFFPSASTTASAANAYLDSGSSPANRLYRSTSSLRYKTAVEDLDPALADRALALRPVWYRSRAAADRTDWSHYGLIAEEVALVEPRLVHYGHRPEDYEEVVVGHALGPAERVVNDDGTADEVRRPLLDADGRPVPVVERRLKAGAEKVPDGVQYERLPVLLLSVVQRQRGQIAALEGRVAALEARLAG